MPKPPVFDMSDPDVAARVRRLHRLARTLDLAFQVPGTNQRFGVDGLIGLIPGIGDAATTALAGYIIYEAHRLGASKGTIARMIGNVGVDFAVGAIPVLGDVFDFAFKANARNLRLLGIDARAPLPGAGGVGGPEGQRARGPERQSARALDR